MDLFSNLIGTLIQPLGADTLAIIFISGYWIFFLLFYGTNHWGKDKLEWADRILLSLPLGFLFWFTGFLLLLLTAVILNELQAIALIRYFWFFYTPILLLLLSRYRLRVNTPLTSPNALEKIKNIPMKKIFFWLHFPLVLFLLFGLGFGQGNSYVSISSRVLWIVLPGALAGSVMLTQVFLSIVLFILPNVVNRVPLEHLVIDNLSLMELTLPFLWLTKSVKRDYLKLRSIATFMRKGWIATIFIIITLLFVILDPVIVFVTPQVTSLKISKNDFIENVVIKSEPFSNEHYLISMSAQYDISLPIIPLMNITLVNPSNYSSEIGSWLTYKTTKIEVDGDLSFMPLFNETQVNEPQWIEIEIRPKWTNERNANINFSYYDEIIHLEVIKFVNVTTIEEGEKYNFYFSVEKVEDTRLEIDDYYLLLPRHHISGLDGYNFNFTAFLNNRDVSMYLRSVNGWLVIHNMYVYQKGIQNLVIEIIKV